MDQKDGSDYELSFIHSVLIINDNKYWDIQRTVLRLALCANKSLLGTLFLDRSRSSNGSFLRIGVHNITGSNTVDGEQALAESARGLTELATVQGM